MRRQFPVRERRTRDGKNVESETFFEELPSFHTESPMASYCRVALQQGGRSQVRLESFGWVGSRSTFFRRGEYSREEQKVGRLGGSPSDAERTRILL